MAPVGRDVLLRWLTDTAGVIAANKGRLSELDAAIGDADHGANLQRGFAKVTTLLPQLKDQDPAAILRAVSMALISAIGGASGPLYGTWFLRAAASVAGKDALTAADLGGALAAGAAGVMARGRAAAGDKTMVDALLPAAQACSAAAAEGATARMALERAAAAAHEGMLGTTGMLARRGRASYLGERSIGHQDPGATSAALILQALADAAGASEERG